MFYSLVLAKHLLYYKLKVVYYFELQAQRNKGWSRKIEKG